MSSITYHFGGKQGLYLAAADHIAGQIGAVHAAGRARGRARRGRPASRDAAIDAVLLACSTVSRR